MVANNMNNSRMTEFKIDATGASTKNPLPEWFCLCLVFCFVFFGFFLQICDFHVSDRQTILVLDNDSPSKYNMQFLNDDFIMETKLSKVTSP